MTSSRLTRRGYTGRGRGRTSYVEAPREFTGTTSQVCGLWPWAVGAASPTIGVPIGPHINGETTVNFDPVTWFEQAKLLLNPSVVVLGVPGLGKSTFVRRLILGLSGAGVMPLIVGDLKPDYVDLIRAIGGQVIALGRGVGSLNLLAVGAMDSAALTVEEMARGVGDAGERVTLTAQAARLRSEAHDRRLNAVLAQLALVRGEKLKDYEDVVLSAALRELAKRWRRKRQPPVMADLAALVEEGPPEVRKVTGWRGEDNRYRAATDKLGQTMLAWLDGPLGEVFGRQTTVPITLDNPGGVCIDVSGISRSDATLQAAALLAKNDSPTKQEVIDHMDGNLCRCMTYTRIRSAVLRAASDMRGELGA